MKLSNVKISSHIISYMQFKQIYDSPAFLSTEQSNIIHSDNFSLHHAKLAVRSQKL